MRAPLSMTPNWMSLNMRTTFYVSGRFICGSSCVSMVHIVLMRRRKSDMRVRRTSRTVGQAREGNASVKRLI
jgi:hypothetical protein